MTDLRTIRRAGGDALRLLVDLLPTDWDPRSGEEETSIVFADIAGYSGLVAESGDDAALAVLAVLDHVVEDAVGMRRGARVVKRLGDGLMIAARRREDGPAIAVQLVEEFAVRSAGEGWPLRLRAGVHRGVVRRQGDDCFGYHVNLAARVAEVAPAGGTLATDDALDGVDLDDLGLSARPAGRLRAKGVNGKVRLTAISPGDLPRVRAGA